MSADDPNYYPEELNSLQHQLEKAWAENAELLLERKKWLESTAAGGASEKSVLGGSRFLRIERCPTPLLWYETLVGCVLPLEFEDEDGYWAREGGVGNALNIVRKTDATVLSLELILGRELPNFYLDLRRAAFFQAELQFYLSQLKRNAFRFVRGVREQPGKNNNLLVIGYKQEYDEMIAAFAMKEPVLPTREQMSKRLRAA